MLRSFIHFERSRLHVHAYTLTDTHTHTWAHAHTLLPLQCVLSRGLLFGPLLTIMYRNPADTVPIFPAGGIKLEVASSPIAVASNSQFPFSPETSGLNLDTSALDSAYTSDMANLEGLSIGSDDWTACSKESLQLSGQMTWDFGFSNAAEWSNFQGKIAFLDAQSYLEHGIPEKRSGALTKP